MVAFCYCLNFAFDKAETSYQFSANILQFSFMIPSLITTIGGNLGTLPCSNGSSVAFCLASITLAIIVSNNSSPPQDATRSQAPYLLGSSRSTSYSAWCLPPMHLLGAWDK